MGTKFVTAVFKVETVADGEIIKEIYRKKNCVSWALDHEILRLELIEHALDNNDYDRAKMYISETDVSRFACHLIV